MFSKKEEVKNIGNPAGIGKGTGFGLRDRDRDGIGLGQYRLRAISNSIRAKSRKATFQESQKTDFPIPWHQIYTQKVLKLKLLDVENDIFN